MSREVGSVMCCDVASGFRTLTQRDTESEGRALTQREVASEAMALTQRDTESEGVRLGAELRGIVAAHRSLYAWSQSSLA